jgi:2-iminobutanoate/2-iminopropanoate deaminase
VTTTFHNPPTAPPPFGNYSHVAEIDLGGTKLLILSGQVALDTEGNPVGDNDLRAQTKYVFDVIGALLAARGASFTNVVNVRAYLTDMTRLRDYAEIRRTYFDDPLPTSTTVEVSGLVHPELLVEVDVTAVVRETT